MNRNVWAPVGAVAAVFAVVAAASLVSTDGRTAGPPVLRIVGAGAADLAVEGGPGSGTYRLTGTLPDGPSEAAVRMLPATAPPVGAVRALAAALGETAAPLRTENAWMAGDLLVADEPGNPWTWGQICDPETAVSSDGTVMSGCAFDAVQPVPPTLPGDRAGIDLPAPLPAPEVVLDLSQALASTEVIRRALELEADRARVEGPYLVLEPLAGGLPTSGMQTRLRLSGGGRLLSAMGVLSSGVDGDRYPLRTAQQALDDLPVLALGAPCDALGCPERPDGFVITGARLGLSRVALEKQSAALVPAWFFDVEGSPVPLVTVAVADLFVAEPDPAVMDPGSKPGNPEPGRPEPGRPEPGRPEPNPGPPTGSDGREVFGFDGAYADADPRVLVVRYGDSGSCPSQAVQHSVVENADSVVVILSRTQAAPDQACTADYQAKLVSVALQEPLAGREVIDGSRTEPLPVSTGSPPFG
ncbi:MAG: hypothetical protein ACR2JF_01095 [Iamia sp.]